MTDALLSRTNFQVEVTVSGLGGDEGLAQRARGAFSEVTGLELTLEPVTFREGGYHAGPRQLVGKTTVPPLILKRGISLDAGFWDWIRRCTDGTYPLPYVCGEVRMLPPDGAASGQAATFVFTNGVVTKLKSAELNAGKASDVPLEELHIVHEGLMRAPS
jgi:phage tail-like protein